MKIQKLTKMKKSFVALENTKNIQQKQKKPNFKKVIPCSRESIAKGGITFSMLSRDIKFLMTSLQLELIISIRRKLQRNNMALLPDSFMTVKDKQVLI